MNKNFSLLVDGATILRLTSKHSSCDFSCDLKFPQNLNSLISLSAANGVKLNAFKSWQCNSKRFAYQKSVKLKVQIKVQRDLYRLATLAIRICLMISAWRYYLF
jgi:hypothetical protein